METVGSIDGSTNNVSCYDVCVMVFKRLRPQLELRKGQISIAVGAACRSMAGGIDLARLFSHLRRQMFRGSFASFSHFDYGILVSCFTLLPRSTEAIIFSSIFLSPQHNLHPRTTLDDSLTALTWFNISSYLVTDAILVVLMLGQEVIAYRNMACSIPSSKKFDSSDRWPSGLRRQLKVISSEYTSVSLVRKGVGSNPTLFNIFFAFCLYPVNSRRDMLSTCLTQKCD
jgi:hypothetical protein